jgi:bacterioferritin-associated ferredoxin
MTMNIKKTIDFFRDLFTGSPFEADKSHIPQPPDQVEQSPDNSNEDEIFYSESSLDIETIEGTPITFGKEEVVIVDSQGNSKTIRKKLGHIMGSDLLVTSLNPTVKDGITSPGVGGKCKNCLQEAALLLEANLISLEEAHRLSLFDTSSGSQCQACGRRLCCKHCRPFEDSGGAVANLCPECTEAAQHQKRFKKAVNLLLSPFTDEVKKLPPADTKGENSNETKN